MRILLFVCLPFLLWSCAQPVPLTGGDKDQTPPKILESSPQNFSRNFSGDKIVLKFDEFVLLKSPTRELIVSPPLKHDPIFVEKDKSIEIQIKDTLLENTTYNFNFGGGIADFTEGNLLDSNRFVFSTGNDLDSAFIEGSIINAFDLKPVKDVLVMLYKDTIDTIVFSEKPYYVSKTKEDGSFILNYLAEGEYRLLACEDLNNNYKLDLAVERIAFYDTLIKVNSDTLKPTYKLRMFLQAPEEQKLLQKKVLHFGMASLKFQKNLGEKTSFEVLNAPENFNLLRVNTTQKDSIVLFWNAAFEGDSMVLISKDSSYSDTSTLRLPSHSKFYEDLEKGKNKVKLELGLNTASNLFDFFDTLKIQSNHPLQTLRLNNIMWVENNDTLPWDSIKTALQLPDSIVPVHPDTASLFWILHYPWQAGVNYTLHLLPQFASDMYGLSHDSLQFSFKMRSKDDYGSLLLKVKGNEMQSYVFELLDDKGNSIRHEAFSGSKNVRVPMLNQGNYSARLVVDDNNNGIWDSGHYLKKRQAEKVIYFPEKIDIRANWDVDFSWDVKK